jgi:ribokinase
MSNSIFTLASLVIACCARVQRFPEPGESLRADTFSIEAGGKGFNVITALHRLGANVDGLIAIGNDFLANFGERAIEAEGLSPALLQQVDAPTGCGVGFIDWQGENCIAVYPGANDALGPEMVEAARERIARSGAIIAHFEVRDAPIISAFGIARGAGAQCFLNPSPYRAISPELLGLCDVLVVNRIEALHLARDLGMTADAAVPITHDSCVLVAERLFAEGPKALVITDGARGAWALRSDGPAVHQRGFRVTAVDTVGAGDGFLAALVLFLVTTGDWALAMRKAAACGAIVAGQSGVLTALPRNHHLEAFLALHDSDEPPIREPFCA